MDAGTRWLAGAVALVAVGCSGPTTMVEPGFRLESDEYVLESSDEEYFCYARTLTEDLAITGFHPEYGEGAHHILFGYTLAPEPEGFSECPVLSKDTWVPLYFGGPRPTDLHLPEGAAVRLSAGTQIFMQLHLQDTSGATIRDRSAIRLETVEPSDALVPVGVFGLDDRTVTLPAHGTAIETTLSCAPARRMEVFAVLGHMHAMGRRIEIFRGDVGTDLLFEQTWYAPEQPTTATTFTIAETDTVSLRCTHENPSDTEVGYGVTAAGEMCSFLLFYTGEDGVDGCIETPAP